MRIGQNSEIYSNSETEKCNIDDINWNDIAYDINSIFESGFIDRQHFIKIYT